MHSKSFGHSLRRNQYSLTLFLIRSGEGFVPTALGASLYVRGVAGKFEIEMMYGLEVVDLCRLDARLADATSFPTISTGRLPPMSTATL
jgi:hypothetical protein